MGSDCYGHPLVPPWSTAGAVTHGAVVAMGGGTHGAVVAVGDADDAVGGVEAIG